MDELKSAGFETELFFFLFPTEESEKEVLCPFRGVETVLVVEDEEDVREAVLEVLGRQGYNVLEADGEMGHYKFAH